MSRQCGHKETAELEWPGEIYDEIITFNYINCIGFQTIYCSEISKSSKILYNLWLKVIVLVWFGLTVNNLFTLDRQDWFLNSFAVLIQL